MKQLNSIAQHFNKVAEIYDHYAVLYQEVAQQMLQRLDFIRLKPEVIVDLGAASGNCLLPLMQRFPQAKFIAVDVAENMLQRLHMKTGVTCLNSAASSLQLADNSVDFVIANLSLSWTQDLTQCVQEVRRVLRPEGLFMFTLFGPDTLCELKQSCRQYQENAQLHEFMDMHNVGDILLQQHFLDPVMDMGYITLTYQTVADLWQEAKVLGLLELLLADPVLDSVAALVPYYEKLRLANGKLPATFEVVYGHAWGPSLSQLVGASSRGEVRVPVSDILRSY